MLGKERHQAPKTWSFDCIAFSKTAASFSLDSQALHQAMWPLTHRKGSAGKSGWMKYRCCCCSSLLLAFCSQLLCLEGQQKPVASLLLQENTSGLCLVKSGPGPFLISVVESTTTCFSAAGFQNDQKISASEGYFGTHPPHWVLALGVKMQRNRHSYHEGNGDTQERGDEVQVLLQEVLDLSQAVLGGEK